jgi:hypothetical protein
LIRRICISTDRGREYLPLASEMIS